MFEDLASSRLAIALDTDDLDTALSWAKGVQGLFGIAKVGLELFSACGPVAIERLLHLGFKVFLDLKLYDIPHTVERSAKVAAAMGVSYLTVHSAGGQQMIEGALTGLHNGASLRGLATPRLLGVTVLTSVEFVADGQIEEKVSTLRAAGANGLVCSANDLDLINALVPDFLKVVPGIRRTQDPLGDQARVASPLEAIRHGADMLVVGRPVTAAYDVRKEAESFHSAVVATLK